VLPILIKLLLMIPLHVTEVLRLCTVYPHMHARVCAWMPNR